MTRTITYLPRSASSGLILFKSSTGHLPKTGDSVSLWHKHKIAEGKFIEGEIHFDSTKNVPAKIVEADITY